MKKAQSWSQVQIKSDKQITVFSIHSASKSIALAQKKHGATTIMGNEKGRNQWKSHQFF